uniref:LRRC8 pannexin-like TM region domain-containing protein n=1 Tax=Kryptolebias marmoratus TaxID=37003 RepID=A0A3Q3AEC4_KRYMA
VASGSFWLHFPPTSSRIEQFLAILAKCCESPWTSQALSHAARQENLREEVKGQVRRLRPPSASPSPSVTCTQFKFCPPKAPVTADRPRQGMDLDKSDGEQARALFERVRRFWSHCESSVVIYKVSELTSSSFPPQKQHQIC